MSNVGSQTRRRHILDANLLHKESPIGNFYSPVIRPKIVGGRLIHVREEDAAYRKSRRDLVGPHPLSPRSRTRQPVDGGIQEVEEAVDDQSAAAGFANSTANGNAVELRRRDNFKLRIDSLGTERDSGQSSFVDASAPLSERRTHGNGLNPYPPLPPIVSARDGGGVAMETAQLLNGLYGRLPPYAGRLTSSPLQLGSVEEYAVMRELQSQLRYLDTAKLKQVYSELADSDDELTGLCSFSELHQAFVRNNIFLSDPLARLVASVFVSPYEAPRINYEKVLSFIGASLHLGSGGPPDSSYYQVQQQQQKQQQQQQASSGGYYRPDEADTYRLPSPPQSPTPSTHSYLQQQQPQSPSKLSTDRDLPRVLRQLESEVAAITDSPQRQQQPINFEALRLAFQRADRLLRGTLSRDQMKRLVWDFNLPISEQTLDNVVALCRPRGGGQYDWEQFVGYLERVIAPQSTGLRIPMSRRPLDYAKHFPEPAASWPHADPAQTLSIVQPAQSLATGAAQPLYRTPSPPPAHTGTMMTQRQAATVALTEPWFNRFMKLADALYRRDTQARGFVSESQVKELVGHYNADLDLGIDQGALQAALNASRVGNGGVNINELLRRLGIKQQGGRL